MGERTRTDVQARADEPHHRPALGLVLVAATATLLALGLVGLPRADAPLSAIARRAMTSALPRWQTTEPVSGVVYGSRAMDTFGETFLLLGAVVSVVVLTRRREPRHGYLGEESLGRREQQADDPRHDADKGEQEARAAEDAEEGEADDANEGASGPTSAADGGDSAPADRQTVGAPAPVRGDSTSIITRTSVRIVLPMLMVAGAYLVVQGYSPGGGFPAGCVLLGVALLAYAGYGYRRIAPLVRPAVLESIELVVALGVIVLLTLGVPLVGSFSANWLPLGPVQTLRSGGTAQAFSLLEFAEVGSGLTITVFTLLGMRHDWTPDESADEATPRHRGQAARGDRQSR